MAEDRASERPTPQPASPTPSIRWDDSQMRTTYANACNVISTREELVLFFGINQGLRSGGSEVLVEVGERIILTPHAAKRLQMMLTNVLQEHESRFGAINVEVRRPTPPVTPVTPATQP
jgi:hypothetical protein